MKLCRNMLQGLILKNIRSKARSKAGKPRACPLRGHRIPMGVCSLATSVAKKTGWCGQWAFAAYPRQAKSRLSAVFHGPIDRAGIFLPFFSQRKPSSHWYTMPPQERACIARHSGFVAASRQFKSFWFRAHKPLVPIEKKQEYTYYFGLQLENYFSFYCLFI